jgi:hypothetical protein
MPRQPTCDWDRVLSEARTILDTEGSVPRPDLWRKLVQRGHAPAHAHAGFRAAVWAAQRRGDFPSLPPARTGPAHGTPWTEDRHAAELVRQQEPTPYELFTSREADCIALLKQLAGVITVRLSPSSFAILAANGYGEFMVRRAVHALVSAGLAELRWEVNGLGRVPCVRAA